MSIDHEIPESKDVMTRPELLVPISIGMDVQFIQPSVPQREPLPLILVANMMRINRS
jgi:hypothetical protein